MSINEGEAAVRIPPSTTTTSQSGEDEEGNSPKVSYKAKKDSTNNNVDVEHTSDENQENVRQKCYKRSKILSCIVRTFRNIFHKYPRICAVLGGIFLPILVITLLSTAFGHLLAYAEAPNECDANDNFLAHQNALQQYQFLLFRLITEIPELCYEVILSKFVERELDTFWNDLNSYLATETDDLNQTATSLSRVMEDLKNVTSSFNATLPLIQNEEEFVLLVTGSTTPINEILDFYLDRKINPDHPLLATSLSETMDDSEGTPPEDDEGLKALHIISLVSDNEMRKHLHQCGQKFVEIAESALDIFIKASLSCGGGLTFDWNRCVDRSRSGIHFSYFGIPFENEREAASHESQEDFYYQTWKHDLERVLLNKMNAAKLSMHFDGTLSTLQYLAIYKESLLEATGRYACEPNSAATAWFWFTVMTTVGYGNQAPVTVFGRAMVFTFGLFCILLFAAVLSTSGYIVIVLLDDCLLNLGQKPLNSIVFACLFWGLLWYVYMIFTAWYAYYYWNDIAHGDFVSFGDAYWFAFVSTTTVGLGDYFVQPEQLFFADVYMFSLLLLFGFVLMSSFLEKCHDALQQLIPKSFGYLLKERLGDPIQKWEDKKKEELCKAKAEAADASNIRYDNTNSDKEKMEKDDNNDIKDNNDSHHIMHSELLESFEQFLKDQMNHKKEMDGKPLDETISNATSTTTYNDIDTLALNLEKEQDVLLQLQEHIQSKLRKGTF